MKTTRFYSRVAVIISVLMLLLLPIASGALPSNYKDFEQWFNTHQSAANSAEDSMRSQIISANSAGDDFYLVVVDTHLDLNPQSTARVTWVSTSADYVNASLSAGSPPPSGDGLFLIYIEEDTYDDILSDPTNSVGSYLAASPADGKIWSERTTAGDEGGNDPQDETWDISENQVDGDVPSDGSNCDLLGGDWDATAECCGDDGADHAQSWAYWKAGDSINLFEDYTADGIINGPPLVTSYPLTNRICSLNQDQYGWLYADDLGGNVANVLGVEIMSDGTNWHIFPADCTITQFQETAASYDYMYTGAGVESVPEQNRWIQCGPGPNDESNGGLNKPAGSMLNCGGTNYVCVQGDGDDYYYWMEEDNIRNDPAFAQSCNDLGSGAGDGVGAVSYVWTGTQCCFGDSSYNDDYTIPVTNPDEYANAGMCQNGLYFPNDLQNVFGKYETDWIVSLGTLHGCQEESQEFMGSGFPPGADLTLIETHQTCDTLTESTHDAAAPEDLARTVFCSADGRWMDIDPVLGDADLVEAQGPPQANLAPNPTLASNYYIDSTVELE